MAEPVLDDIAHLWGEDVRLSPTGDLGRSNRHPRSQERVIRRLMTNPGEYIFHPNYGGGLRQMVGQNIDIAKIRARIEGQMLLETSVVRDPPPQAVVVEIPGGVSVKVQYLSLPDKQPVSLSFDVLR